MVEYATVAWSPHTNKGIDSIEFVQRRAARFVNSDYRRYSSVSSMLTDLNWPSLQSRRRICNLGKFYKIHRGQVNISLPYDLTSVPAYGRTRASHDFKIRLPSLFGRRLQTLFLCEIESLRGTSYQLMLLVRHLTQNLSEEIVYYLSNCWPLHGRISIKAIGNYLD